ncbi:DNA-binding response regulator [Oscillospiraceae bacterium]|nr:DNA-binding response regulator [Oscillospiraceae bacterium]BDF73974.1 DNA-binding response regulator [Oscillospiraceae bacterium]
MPETILVVEDERRIRDVVRDYFTAHGADCDLARNGEEALDLLRDHEYDAILLDILMPGLDGYAVCRAVREKSGVPVIFLTALCGEEEALRGYELGADDYVTKPFSLAVLHAKTLALIRRSRGGRAPGEALRCGAISLDPGRRACTAAGEDVRLTPRSFDLLECLLRNRGRVMSREQLLDKVWGLDFEGDARAVDVQVKNLRAALGGAGGQIKTVLKAGYKLEEGGA